MRTVTQLAIIRYISSCNAVSEPPEIDLNRDIWNNLISAQGFISAGLNPEQSEDFANILNNRDVTGMRNFAGELGNNALSDFVDRLRDAAAQNPIIREVEELCRQEEFKKTTWYLSTVLRALPTIRNSAPFISPETLFLNPHEDEVEVRWPYRESGKSDFISNSEALIFTLPGMWTHRVFEGQRFYVSSGMRAIPHENRHQLIGCNGCSSRTK